MGGETISHAYKWTIILEFDICRQTFTKVLSLIAPPNKKHYWNKHILKYVIAKKVIFNVSKGYIFTLSWVTTPVIKGGTYLSKTNNIEYNSILLMVSAKYDTCKLPRIKIIITIKMMILFFSKKLIFICHNDQRAPTQNSYYVKKLYIYTSIIDNLL